MQFIQHICSLLNTVIRLLVIDEPVGPRAATPFYSVDTIIASNQMDHDTPILFALTHELRLVIKQKIEESETNGLDNRRFTCAIDSTDGSSAAAKIQVDLAVAFNILQLNTCNQHSDGTRPSQQWNSLKNMKGQRISPNWLFSSINKKVEIASAFTRIITWLRRGGRYFSLTLSNRNFKPRWAVNLSRTITT